MQKCTKCDVLKPFEEFSWRNKSAGRRNSWCKSCISCARKDRYYLKYEEERHQRKRWKEQQRHQNQISLLEYLKCHPCVDCGNANPIVLEFDHREQAEKFATISSMISTTRWTTILDEISKCDVRCANCHRIRTSRQLGWWYENKDG